MLGYDDYDAFRKCLIFVLTFHRELTLPHTVQRCSASSSPVLWWLRSNKTKLPLHFLFLSGLIVQLTNRIHDKQLKRRGSCQDDRGEKKASGPLHV